MKIRRGRKIISKHRAIKKLAELRKIGWRNFTEDQQKEWERMYFIAYPFGQDSKHLGVDIYLGEGCYHVDHGHGISEIED